MQAVRGFPGLSARDTDWINTRHDAAFAWVLDEMFVLAAGGYTAPQEVEMMRTGA